MEEQYRLPLQVVILLRHYLQLLFRTGYQVIQASNLEFGPLPTLQVIQLTTYSLKAGLVKVVPTLSMLLILILT
jgi:hypothetical protein